MMKLTKQQVIEMHKQLICETGGSHGIIDVNLLESALEAPYVNVYGCAPYSSVQMKAARLAFGLIRNHSFVDGNKRIGTHVMLVYLALNGIELKYKPEELIDIIYRVTKGEADYYVLYHWILDHELCL